MSPNIARNPSGQAQLGTDAVVSLMSGGRKDCTIWVLIGERQPPLCAPVNLLISAERLLAVEFAHRGPDFDRYPLLQILVVKHLTTEMHV